MPITYDVKLEHTKTENAFRITWTNSAIPKKFDPGNVYVSISLARVSSNLSDI